MVGNVYQAFKRTFANDRVYLGKGDGTFGSGIPLPGILSGSVGVADFDGDGRMDLIELGSKAGSLLGIPFDTRQLFLGNGDGTFRMPKFFQSVGGTSFVGDFNMDGKPDVFGGFAFMLGKGDATFQPPLFIYTPPYGCFKPLTCGAAIGHAVTLDSNGDGLPDVAYEFTEAYHVVPTQVLLFINAGKGDGILASAVSAATGIGLAASQSLASIYGVDLVDRRESATGSQFPTTLGGIRVHIGDQLAPLAFVSPAQINYLFPPWPTSAGSRFYNPTITIEHVGKPFIPKGISAPTVPEAPGFFSVGSSGLAAALAVRVSSDGIQTPVPVFDCSQSPCTAVPIDTSGDPVYLSLFGTGINNFNTTSPGYQFTCSGGLSRM